MKTLDHLPVLDPPLKRPTPSTFVTGNPAELERILEPGVNMALWQRSVAPELVRFVDAELLPRTVKRVVSSAGADIDPALLLDGIAASSAAHAFCADVSQLIDLYVRLTGAARLTLKLESFGGNLCERFHVDNVPLRLICSYAGPGTEWLDEHDVNRDRLGPASRGLPDEASGLLRPGARVLQMERFDVGLMKGDRWPGNQGRALVHRSPHAGDTGLRRVLLKIDGA